MGTGGSKNQSDGQRNPKGEAQPRHGRGDAFRPNVLPDADTQGIEQRLNRRREPKAFFVEGGGGHRKVYGFQFTVFSFHTRFPAISVGTSDMLAKPQAALG